MPCSRKSLRLTENNNVCGSGAKTKVATLLLWHDWGSKRTINAAQSPVSVHVIVQAAEEN